MKLAYFLLFVNFFSLQVFSQTPLDSYFDNELKPDSYVHDVVHREAYAYIGGSSTNSCGPTPFLAKISLQTGESVWNTNVTVNGVYQFPQYMTRVAVIDDGVYGLSPGFTSTDKDELWKVDEQSGVLKWRIQFDDSYAQPEWKIFDYSATELLIDLRSHAYLVNKSTGAMEKKITGGSEAISGVGNNSEIYLARTKLSKVVNLDFANPVPIIDIPSTSCAWNDPWYTYNVDATRVLLVGSQGCENHGIYLVDVVSKQIIWTKNAGVGVAHIADYRIQDGFLYISWRSAYTGGEPVKVTKQVLNTGEILWKSTQLYSTIYDGQAQDKIGMGIGMSMAVDNDGDVFITGPANMYSNGSEMGVMKLSGETGERFLTRSLHRTNRTLITIAKE